MKVQLLPVLVTLWSMISFATEQPPKLRLSEVEDISPSRYRVDLSLDPDKTDFTGSISIQLAVIEDRAESLRDGTDPFDSRLARALLSETGLPGAISPWLTLPPCPADGAGRDCANRLVLPQGWSGAS